MRPVPDNGGNQCSLSGLCPCWHAASLALVYLYTPDLSAPALCLVGLSGPKIEIIRTGREKRKSENVSECAYRPPRPILCQSLHPSLLHCLLSVLFSVDRGSRQAAGWAEEGWRLFCVVWIGWPSAGEVGRSRVIKFSRLPHTLESWYDLWPVCLCASLRVFQTHWISADMNIN